GSLGASATILHSAGVMVLLRSVTIPPSTRNLSSPWAMDGTAWIFVRPEWPMIPLYDEGDLTTIKFIKSFAECFSSPKDTTSQARLSALELFFVNLLRHDGQDLVVVFFTNLPEFFLWPDKRSMELHPYSPGPCTSLSLGGTSGSGSQNRARALEVTVADIIFSLALTESISSKENLDVDIDDEDKAVLLVISLHASYKHFKEIIFMATVKHYRLMLLNLLCCPNKSMMMMWSQKVVKGWLQKAEVLTEKPEKAAEVAIAKGDSDGDVYLALDIEKSRDELIVDSGCTFHMIPHQSWFTTYESFYGDVQNRRLDFFCGLLTLNDLELGLCDMDFGLVMERWIMVADCFLKNSYVGCCCLVERDGS
nr:retrovirus-related Pol polyprotein from transposon TNT 1-94 [Tanacetum cinerariifolium]